MKAATDVIESQTQEIEQIEEQLSQSQSQSQSQPEPRTPQVSSQTERKLKQFKQLKQFK
jgi:hypothetical protein